MKNIIYNKSGFTLIELISVMIIAGFLVLIGSMVMINAVKSYITDKTTSNLAGKGQIAMMRISKEFKNLTSVTPGKSSSTSIQYQIYRNGSVETHKLSWGGTAGDSLLYNKFLFFGDILVDKVKNFQLAYYDFYNDSSPNSAWVSSSKVIGVTLELLSVDNTSFIFTEKIMPRNLP